MLMAAMRLNIPTVFVSGGPMEAGKLGDKEYDLIDVMVRGADESYPDEELAKLERVACPTCGSCSGMFTANSMNCLTEALGLSLPGNGTILATHALRTELFKKAAKLIVKNANEYYFNDKLPRMSHGTGDVYASAFVGAYMNGKSVYESASIAADFTVRTIEATMDDESHWYGVKFEKELPYLIDRLK